MKLGAQWFYSPYPDEELKAYETLAFSQFLSKALQSNALYPALNELNFQLNLINTFTNQLNEEQYLGKRLIGFDYTNQKIKFKTSHDNTLYTVQRILGFFKKKIEPYKQQFDNLFHDAIKSINVNPVGIVPSYLDEGWILIRLNNEMNLFRYDISRLFGNEGSLNYNYQFVERIQIDSVHQIKMNIVKTYPDLPNPATWYVDCPVKFSIIETVIPVSIQKIHEAIKK